MFIVRSNLIHLIIGLQINWFKSEETTPTGGQSYMKMNEWSLIKPSTQLR